MDKQAEYLRRRSDYRRARLVEEALDGKNPSLPAPPAPKHGGAAASAVTSELEAQTCSCQVCYELMMGSSKAPVLLTPCGHTFCRECVSMCRSAASSSSGGKCPLCRARITSVAENIVLKQIIERLDDEQRKRNRAAAALRDGKRTASLTELGEASSSLFRLRLELLSEELKRTEQELAAISEKRESARVTVAALSDEKRSISCKLGELEEELELVGNHLQQAKQKSCELANLEESKSSKAAVLRRRIASLEVQVEKEDMLQQQGQLQ